MCPPLGPTGKNEHIHYCMKKRKSNKRCGKWQHFKNQFLIQTANSFFVLLNMLGLIISLFLDESSRVVTENVFSNLVVCEDEDGIWHGSEPPVDLEGVHAETDIHSGGV